MRRQAAGPTFGRPPERYDPEDQSRFRADLERLLAGALRSSASSLPWVTITDAPYSADNTGSSNSTTAIQTAIDDVALLGGGIVYAPAGTYLVSAIRMKTGVQLWGAGWATIFTIPNNNHTAAASGTGTASAGGSNTLTDASKAWVANSMKGFTIHITAGTGSGQKRKIKSNTSTQVTTADTWVTNPDATSVYAIYNGKHVFVLNAASVEFMAVRNLQILGNKSNQLALIDGFHCINTGGGPSFTDTHHLADHVLINEMSGCGITLGRDCREMRVINGTRAEACDEYGSTNLVDETASGSSDNKFVSFTAAHCGLTGINAFHGHSSYIGCKAFGNGVRNISGNGAGFIVNSRGNYFASCEAQENRLNGWQVTSFSNIFAACVSDANGGMGLLVDGGTDNQIDMLISSTNGLLYQTASAVKLVNGADRNTINIQAISGELSASLIDAGSTIGADTWLRINNRWYGKLLSHFGAVGVDSEHYRFGKEGSPAASNPAYYLKTSSSNPPKANIEGYDGTTTVTFLTLDHAAATLAFGGGTGIKKYLSGSGTFNLGNIVAGGTGTLAITVTGAVSTDLGFASPDGGLESGLTIDAIWCQADEVHVRLRNTTGGDIDPASRSWRAGVFKH